MPVALSEPVYALTDLPPGFALPAPPDAFQASLDRLLDHFSQCALRPALKLDGDALQVGVLLGQHFEDIIPDHLRHDGEIILSHLVDCFCAYCEAARVHFLSLHFVFKKDHVHAR